MPQIVRGGKYVFGWTVVHTTGQILVPKEAYDEYQFNSCEQIVLLSGSTTSGGFAMARPDRLNKGPFQEILTLLNYSKKKTYFSYLH